MSIHRQSSVTSGRLTTHKDGRVTVRSLLEAGVVRSIYPSVQIALLTSRVQVLDEADKMLEFDYEQELMAILELVPKKRQTCLYSATMTTKVSIPKWVCRAWVRNGEGWSGPNLSGEG